MSRKHSVFRLLIPAAIVGGLLWWAKLWPFSRGTSPPPARIPNVADAARQAYERLGDTFRDRVPLGDFAGMYEKMADRDTGARPRIRHASVTDVTDGGPPVLTFRVDYPDVDAKAGFKFSRHEGTWTTLSLVRVLGNDRLPGLPAEDSRSPVPPEPGPSKGTKAEEKEAEEVAKAPPAGVARYHTIKKRDSLWTIAEQYYGKGKGPQWVVINEANPGLNPKRMKPGEKILIPTLPEKTPRPETAAGNSTAAGRNGP